MRTDKKSSTYSDFLMLSLKYFTSFTERWPIFKTLYILVKSLIINQKTKILKFIFLPFKKVYKAGLLTEKFF